jgi:hypothetical protein
MKLPEKIKGRNKIRDAKIVVGYKKEGLHYSELAEKFKLTERRILQILSTNHSFIKRDKEWEKEKRIALLNQWVKKNPETKKDTAEILELLRKEIEGDKPEVLVENHQHITYAWKDSNNIILPTRISERNTLPPSEI